MKLISRTRHSRGFALVVTLSLMILLTVVAVGLLTLSTISLRTTSQSADLSAARANARMALILALGELQKNAGPDTRVTARADLVDADNAPVLGVWRSWEGTNHDATGRPISPTYADHKSARFLSWLTSASVESTLAELPDTKKSGSGKATLLGENSVGSADPDRRQIHLAPTRVNVDKARGGYAWWVSGENQKARLPRPYAPATDSAATWAVHAKSHASADTSPFGLDSLLTDPSLRDPSAMSIGEKAISFKGIDLLDSSASPGLKTSQEHFHDLTVNSVGLLTNTATGGWRKDLSLLSENWTSLPTSNLPLFRVNPSKDLSYTRPAESDALRAKSILYPWSDYRRGATENVPIYSFPAIGSWANLVDYANFYKVPNATAASGAMSVNASASPINGSGTAVYNFIHKVRILPVIARVQWVFSHKSIKSTNPAYAGRYDLHLLVTPVITLWNPYNVRIASTGALTFRLNGSLPPVISYTVGGTALPKKVTLQTDRLAGQTASEAKGLAGISNYTLASIPAFAPGETRIFSPSGAGDTLVAGLNPNGGRSYVVETADKTYLTAASKISTQVKFDSEFTDAGATGVGLYLDMNHTLGTVLAYRMLYDKSAATAAYPALPVDRFPNPSMVEAELPVPFLSVTFGARMASNTHLPSKGFVQSSPFVNYTAMGKKGAAEPTIQYSYPGSFHNVNSPFEFSFHGLKAVDDYFPEVGANNRGFILTGFRSTDGLSRCVIAELPGRPISSLAELQNWDARYENPVPPFAFNLVANSDATPLIPANAVFNSSEASAKGAQNLQHDDSYCLNHLLFDDWFFSSITPEPAAFGRPSVASRSVTTYANLLSDPTKPLANRAYKPLSEDTAFASVSKANATTLANKNVGVASTSWKTIASRLEVEGMFNVNSTSVKAWRALLGHARNQRVPYTNSAGNPDLSGETDHAFSRFSVAGDVEASESGSSGGVGGGAEFAGYRVFDESQLNFLAEEIVNQVRLRGPFLSLSEFVNRQLSSGELALAGAVQTALNKLSESPQNPFGVLQEDYTKDQLGTNIATEDPPGGITGYKFSEAAVGYNMYGVPGWTRQADVLRAIAPVLSARDDTFVIRAYGDARDATGNVIKARAVCEATIQRSRNFVDHASGADPVQADLSNSSGTVPVKSTVNERFGRRFKITSFRWLSPNEI